MSIADKLTRLSAARDDIIDALDDKGVTATGHGFEDFPDDIAAITGGGGGTVVVWDEADSHGGTIRHIEATNVVPSGTAGTPTATKGTVSNHTVAVTPSVVNTTGYINGGTKTGTPVTVSASELVSGSETKNENGTYDVTNLQTLVVNVASGKNAQISPGFGRTNQTTYTAISGQSITVAKTGTYDVYWTGYRSSTSGTNGSQLYIGSTAYGSANTSFDGTLTNCQSVHLSNVSLTQGQIITVRARARSTSYYMYIFGLTIIEA